MLSTKKVCHNCIYIKNKAKQPVLLEVRIAVTFEHAGGYWKWVVCVCGASGDTVNTDSDLGSCYIGNCDMFVFCMPIIFQNKTVLFNVCEKLKFHNSTHTMNPFWLTSTCQYRTPGRIYTQIVLSLGGEIVDDFFLLLFLKTIFSTACILFIMYYFYKNNYT